MKTRALTRNEVRQVMNACKNKRDKALLAIGFNCGYRISEILSLKIKDVCNIRNSKIFIRDVIRVAKDNMKGKKKDRAIRLNSDAKKVLLPYLLSTINENISDKPLFNGRKNSGKKAITRQHAWRIITDLSEKVFGTSEGIGTHSLRKSFATHMYFITKDYRRVSKYLGHAFVITTERYIEDDLNLSDDIEQLALI